jgi:hypothetical protein
MSCNRKKVSMENGCMLMRTYGAMCMGMCGVKMERGEKQKGEEEKSVYSSTPRW